VSMYICTCVGRCVLLEHMYKNKEFRGRRIVNVDILTHVNGLKFEPITVFFIAERCKSC